MEKSLENSLAQLINANVQVSLGNGYPVFGQASLRLEFSDGTWLQAEYWRVTENGQRKRSSFDHEQIYGLPAPIDAIQELREAIGNEVVTDATVDRENGDLFFHFGDHIKLQILNVTAYEIFEIRFPDGTGEYSNYL